MLIQVDRLSNEILDEYLHAECSHLFQVSDTYVDALLDDELSPGGVDA